MLPKTKQLSVNTKRRAVYPNELGANKKPRVNNLVEGGIQHAIMDYLRLKGHYPVRINTQGVPMWNGEEFKGFRKSPMRGVADILGVSKFGQFFAIEVKRPDKNATLEQLEFLQEVRKRKGIAIVAKNLNDVITTGL